MGQAQERERSREWRSGTDARTEMDPPVTKAVTVVAGCCCWPLLLAANLLLLAAAAAGGGGGGGAAAAAAARPSLVSNILSLWCLVCGVQW